MCARRCLVGLGGIFAVLVGVSVTSGAVITFLDFEDGQLPSAHGWLPWSGVSSSVVQANTNQGPSKVLRSSGSSHFGWLYDLSGVVDHKEAWVFEADMRQTSHDISLWVDSEVFTGGKPTAASYIMRDNQWHHVRMEMDYDFSDARAFVDGAPVTPEASWGSGTHNWFSSKDYYIMFYFGNIGWSSTFYADNVRFESIPSQPPIPEPSALIIWALLGALGTGVGWWRKRTGA